MIYKNFSIVKMILFFVLCSILTSSGFGEPAFVVEYRKWQLEALTEIGIGTDGNIVENASKYYKKMFGDHFEFKKLYHVTLGQACHGYPINPNNMDLFKGMMIAPYIPFINWDFVYLAQKYRSNHKTLNPKRYYLAKSPVLSDMLYWEWNVDDIQLRKLESKTGMLLFIIPKDFDPIKGISRKRCIEVLMQVTKISCEDPDELQKQFHFPPVLREGDVFSNIPNFEKITGDFPIPTDPDQWRKQFVGFISKDAICLILVHGQFPKQQVINNDARWLSGKILHKDTKTPVLPHGVTKMPESWKPVLEYNAKWEKWGLEMAEKEREEKRIEESKWRVWYDKNGKSLNNGVKMKFEYWDKRPTFDSRFKAGTVSLKSRNEANLDFISYNFHELPLSEFSAEDKKLILAVPPLKIEPFKGQIVGSSLDKEPPKAPEPEEDDIE